MKTKENPELGRDGAGKNEKKLIIDTNKSDSKSQYNDDISIFRGINKRPIATTTWQEALENIRSDKYEKPIENVRAILRECGSGSPEYRKAKTQLNAVTFGGVFSPTRAMANILSPTGFIIPDLDHLNERTKIVFRLLTQDKNVWFVFRSPSGEGLKVGIRSQGIKCDADHKRFYFAIEKYFKDAYGLEIDPACKDIARLTFVSHDPDLWVNPDPQYFDISAWTKPLPDYPPQPVKADFTHTAGKEKYARKVLESCCEKIRQSLPGSQHHTRLKAARLIGGYLQYIDKAEVMAALEQAVQESGAKNMRAAMKTVRDGLEYGKLSPITISDIQPGPAHGGAIRLGQVEPQNGTTETPFENAKKLYPRGSFPWSVLPESITKSLQQLARSCATSPTSLPGAAIAIFASTIGNTVNVYPKRSWREPLIFWVGDIRPSGEGKTAPPRALMHVLYVAQKRANDDYKLKLDAWDLLPKRDRGNPPDKPRGYYVTDLTLEGLRADHSGHGGKVCVLDELSAFLTSQNQYKKKGSDRESWLCLHDGNPARIVRAKETLTLEGCRISVFGGIQPGIWQKIFSENDGIHLLDGTIYRFLPTYEGSAFYPLTKESWSDDNRRAWEYLIRDALSWADSQKEPQSLFLSEGAQNVFFRWRNDLFQMKNELPAQVQGFIPKLVGYALRFAGIFYLMHRFCQDQETGPVISRDYIEKGIRASEFYLGHIICAMEALAGDAPIPLELTEQIVHLARTLEGLRPEVDSGRLAVGYIQEKFNKSCKPEQRIRTARGMGALIRHCKLTIPGGTFNANGKESVKCLQWDEKTNSFLETCLQSLQSLQSESYQGLQGGDIKKRDVSNVSRQNTYDSQVETLETLKNQCLQAKTRASTTKRDIGDIGDEFSKKNKKPDDQEFEDFGAFCSDRDED